MALWGAATWKIFCLVHRPITSDQFVECDLNQFHQIFINFTQQMQHGQHREAQMISPHAYVVCR